MKKIQKRKMIKKKMRMKNKMNKKNVKKNQGRGSAKVEESGREEAGGTRKCRQAEQR